MKTARGSANGTLTMESIINPTIPAIVLTVICPRIHFPNFFCTSTNNFFTLSLFSSAVILISPNSKRESYSNTIYTEKIKAVITSVVVLKNEESASVILLNPSAAGRFLKKSVTYVETAFASNERPPKEIPLKFATS